MVWLDFNHVKRFFNSVQQHFYKMPGPELGKDTQINKATLTIKEPII